MAGENEPEATPEAIQNVATNPRMLAMEALDNERIQRMAADGEIAAIEPEPVQAVAPAETVAGSTAADDQLSTQLGGGAAPAMVTVKVNGVETQVTVEELTRNYQKGLAADQRFQEAARERAEAERLVEEANKLVQGVATVEKQGHTSTNAAPDAVAEAREIVSALFGGDEDMAVDALVKLGVVGRKQGEPTPDIAQIAAQITPQVRQQLVAESALEKFEVDNAFIVADPYLARMADEHLAAAQQEGKSFTEALEYAAEQTRDWCKQRGMKVPDKPTPTTTRQNKLERKSTIDVVRGVGAKTAVQTEPEYSVSNVLSEMRQARGLAA